MKWLSSDELAAWVRLMAVVELLPGVLDTQLRKDADLTSYEYYVLAMLSEAPERTLRMTALAAQTNATLPRLSHVVRRLEDRGLVERRQCPQDGRATNARLTSAGWRKVRRTAPGHVATVRDRVMDALNAEQVSALTDVTQAVLGRLDPDGTMTSLYQRHDRANAAGPDLAGSTGGAADPKPDAEEAPSSAGEQIAQATAAERLSLSPECRADPACLRRLLSPDFHEFGASGGAFDYAGALARVAVEQPAAGEPLEASDMHGRLVADGIVMITYTCDDGGRRSNRTSLWRRVEPGRWQMFHHQGTPVLP